MSSPSAVKRALAAIETLQRRVDDLEARRHDPIAIVGLGARFPGAPTPDAFWQLVRDGGCAVTTVPSDRWDVSSLADSAADGETGLYSRHGGFLPDIDRFDAGFFGIAPREAASLDPQQRLWLEVAWEALEHAAIAADGLRDSRTGVYLGMSAFDQALVLARSPALVDAYYLTGNTLNVAAGRLSYVLGSNGPSLSVDTACSSSLVAVHLACQGLRAGDCDLALAGGVGLMLTPEPTLSACRAHMLSATGRCRAFDDAADGYVRGDGAGAVVLERVSDARANGHRVLAVVRGSAVNHAGASGGLTVPNGRAQQDLVREALGRAGVSPGAIGLVETHGTGTPLGDPIELEALGAVLLDDGGTGRPTYVGSVKNNIGHLEAAAGIAGLIKIVLALAHRTIPPHIACDTPNRRVAWTELPLAIPREAIPWESQSPRIAAVSSFGFSGTNAHVIVEEAAASAPVDSSTRQAPELHLVVASAKTDAALGELARRYAAFLRSAPDEDATLAAVSWTTIRGRAHLPCRLALVVDDCHEAAQLLTAFADGDVPPSGPSWFNGHAPRSHEPSPMSASGIDLYTVAQLWVAGTPIDWSAMFPSSDRPRVAALPTYPFERTRFPAATAAARPAEPARRPASVGAIVRAAARPTDGSTALVADVAPESLRVFAGHRAHGAAVVPATGFLEMAAALADRAWGPGRHRVEKMIFRTPLRLNAELGRIRVSVSDVGDEQASFAVESLPAGSTSPRWTLHASAVVRRDPAERSA